MRRAGIKSSEFEAAIVAAETASGCRDRDAATEATLLRRHAEALLAQAEAGEAIGDDVEDAELSALYQQATKLAA